MSGTDWSQDEVELIVADYFAMLREELAGHVVNKAEHNRRLQARLDGRSKGSIEFKHANITAALLNLRDGPYIEGYKPRWNYQQRLEKAVLEYLDAAPDLFEHAAQGPVVQPTAVPDTDFANVSQLIETPPEHRPPVERRDDAPLVRAVDFVRMDAENRRLGRMGEEWALEFERRRLHDIDKRPDLAKRIVWVSDTEGDGAGYDIRSFNGDDTARLIEVKTTGLGKYVPFAVTANEVRTSKRQADLYHLYRVFHFAVQPRVYTLQGALADNCRLDPTVYRARVR
jgi:hypothetical protein